MTTALNIAAGKLKPIDINSWGKYFLINLDIMYFSHEDPRDVEFHHSQWLDYKEEDNKKHPDVYPFQVDHKVATDAFEFMEKSSIEFDLITCYRFLEHVRKTDIQYFIYLMSTSLKIGGQVDIIVPDYETLAELLLKENPGEPSHWGWEQHDTLLTYEMLNEPGNPHASIWTAQRLDYFFTLEERFKPVDMKRNYNFDGRDCYIRYIAERVK
jgi:predicted SAM-dependent methyltransferase